MGGKRSRKREQWVLVAEQLVHNSAENVPCPECGTASLQVRDVEYGWGHGKGLERYLVCSHCKAYSSVNMRRAGAITDNQMMAAQ